MRKDRNNLNNYQSPESPRAKTSEFQTLKEAMDKAKKYDELIDRLKSDSDIIKLNLNGYKSEVKPLKIGYVAGYVDGKISAYENILQRFFNKYIED